MLCFIFHIKGLPPKMPKVIAAHLLIKGDLLKLPCEPSCIMLKPMAEIIPPNKADSSNANTTEGVKNTR